MPAPIELQPVRVGVDLDGDAMRRAGFEDLINLDIVGDRRSSKRPVI
jgi:hypothetical protein